MKINEFIKQSIENLIKFSSSAEKIEHLQKKHLNKIHFIPVKYRIFNGLLQSMNIQFGNFIESLLYEIIKNEKNLSIIKEVSGSKNIEISITKKSDNLIDEYITSCQTIEDKSNENLKINYWKMIDQCFDFEKKDPVKEIRIKHDVDILFKDKNENYYYLEVKYNDDHDTGKFIDINRKFIKTYIGISNILKIWNRKKLKPILYYLNNKRMKGNIYIPEKECIYRGDKLFLEFFTVKYLEVDESLTNIGNNIEVLRMFDNLYEKIVKKKL